MSVEIVTIANRIPDRAKEPYYRPDIFLKSLDRFEVKPTILGLNESWGGLMTKPRRLRQFLREGRSTAETLIVCDMFDIVFTVSPDEIAQAYRRDPRNLIWFNAEKGLFPRGELTHVFKEAPHPWRFLNSGFMIGPPQKILALLEAMWLDDIHDDIKAIDELHGGAGRWINPNDQGWFQLMYAAQVVPIMLDTECEFCQSLSACTIEEFDLSGERIKNVLTQSTPFVFHFNGGSKNDLMPIFLKYWGLE